jgi:hypothetical protein
MGCCPLLLYILDMLLFSLNTLSLFIPYLVAPPWRLLKRSAAKIISHLHLEKWRRRRSFRRIPTFAGPRAWRTSPNRTCDRLRRRRRLWRLVHDLEIVKWTTTYIYIESSSAMFVRERRIPLPIFEGEFFVATIL